MGLLHSGHVHVFRRISLRRPPGTAEPSGFLLQEYRIGVLIRILVLAPLRVRHEAGQAMIWLLFALVVVGVAGVIALALYLERKDLALARQRRRTSSGDKS